MLQICMILTFNLNLNAERLIVYICRGHGTALGAILQVLSTLLCDAGSVNGLELSK